MKPRIAITAGDINGVGYEVILKSLNEPYILEICVPIIYGNISHLEAVKKQLPEVNIKLNKIEKVGEEKENHIYVVNCYADDVPMQQGTPTKEAGQAALACLAYATSDLRNGKVQAMVTAPINKDTVQNEKFTYTGHTEFLQAVFARPTLMMMLCDELKVALVTDHLPVTQIATHITSEKIVEKLCLLNESLKHDFTIRMPKIAVLALNPHAGDNGLLGQEEQEIIIPALKQAYEQGVLCFGPFAADGFFGAGQYKNYDAVLAMYHDQGLAPFKTIDMTGVNYTAGLPVVRTSPDHGTAYDLAGKNEANHYSMLHAIWKAVDIYKARQIDKEINENPLEVTDKHNNKRDE